MLVALWTRLKSQKRYLVDLAIVAMLLLSYRAVQSYRHFEWVSLTDSKGVLVIPAFRK